MRILKAKIAKSLKHNDGSNSPSNVAKKVDETPTKTEETSFTILNCAQEKETPKTHHNSPHLNTSPHKRSQHTKESCSSINIMKNYCRGILTFALSPIALNYLTPMLQEQQIHLKTFRKFVQSRKSKINCIKQLREMILVLAEDDSKVAAMKKIFQEITIRFLKFFVPNWLYNSKIAEKYAHLRYRFKILRRVKNPLHFTYLQSFSTSAF